MGVRRKELASERKEKALHHFLLTFSLVSLFLFLLIMSVGVLELTGYSTFLSSRGGYITEVSVTSSIDVAVWSGFYGLVLRVPDFTQQLSEDLPAGEIERADVFFDCLQVDAQGGAEFYASTNPSLSLTPATVSPGTVEMVDSFINCSGEVYCADLTYVRNMTIFLGSTNISGIPSTFTYKWNGENEVFDIGVLNVSGELAFVSHVNASIHQGFNPNVLVNYQMLLPAPTNTTQTFYFYNDPNDACPSGGIGNSIFATIYGYVFDSLSNGVVNATVTVAGNSTQTDSSGFYNLSTEVLEGTYNFLVQGTGYDPYLDNVTVTFSNFTVEKNATLSEETPSSGAVTVTTLVFGFVNNTAGTALSEVNISFGNATTVTNSSGRYSFLSSVVVGNQPFIAVKEDYDNFVTHLNISSGTSVLSYNFTMEAANLNDFPTGPFTEQNVDDAEGDDTESEKEKAKELAEELGQDFWVSTSEINKQVRENTFIEEKISIFNFKSTNMQVLFSISPELEDIIDMDRSSFSISPDSSGDLSLTISGTKPVGVYRGTLTISGDLDIEVPVKIEIVPRKFNVESLLMEIELVDGDVNLGDSLRYQLDLQNLLTEQGYRINLKHLVLDSNGTTVFYEEEEEVEIQNSLTILKDLSFGEELEEGEYVLEVEATYLNLFSSVTTPFEITRPLYLYSFFGIPLWIVFVALSALSFAVLNVFLYNRHQQKKKRFHTALRADLLPKPGERSIKLGRIAEKKIPAYYNIDDLTTHAIVAGATGGGKSISAQVFIEEMLMKNISVIVFDPTAQWSGMLRKCDDKKMLSFYPQFGLKPSDARAFPGNVRQVTNHLQSIDINKYMNPGQIQVFALSKLDPKQIDIFVAGVISNIFKSDPKEHPGLRTVLVFDEVHRLLPKFGGSGKGFLQIERACREFRKWGFGVMLVSQVLSDFVGEIKANINTEVQMRVAEENDLERIRERYGLDALKSLVRAGVGTGMIQNAEYNKGLPYFVSFRPILHNTRRLSDEVLEKYNKYNETIEDLEFQIEQLEKEKVDTFDLKMELKLVKDKLMTGNFTVVDIYLEGLGPRLEKQWASLGKKPKKRELALIDVSELESSLAKAEKERKTWNDKNAPKETESEKPKKVDPGTKIVKPLTFDNGMMVSSLNELRDVLPNLDESVLKVHVNDEKNEIAEWAAVVDQGLSEKLKGVKDKAGMLKVIEEFGKSSGGAKKEGEEKEDGAKSSGKEKEKGGEKDGEKGNGEEKGVGEEEKGGEEKVKVPTRAPGADSKDKLIGKTKKKDVSGKENSEVEGSDDKKESKAEGTEVKKKEEDGEKK